jgi:hypothetical protein
MNGMEGFMHAIVNMRRILLATLTALGVALAALAFSQQAALAASSEPQTITHPGFVQQDLATERSQAGSQMII